MPNVGPMEIVILLVVALLVFGPKRLPEMGRSIGKGMREFKNSISGNDDDDTQAALPPPGDEAEVVQPKNDTTTT
jgi:sec-independent protein translocase protein TatA